ncbi:uncharacterized protein [Antedon mediterranea]|uniref:uncharacterized protein n=1 Tax=Antedon mediterranea TaxID=105859 RepID=UPI003AF57914
MFLPLDTISWRKLQTLGLASMYMEDEQMQHFCGTVDGLAFLPSDKAGQRRYSMQHLRENSPEVLEDFLDYFDTTYVNGTYSHHMAQPGEQHIFRRIPPMFDIDLWNVYHLTLKTVNRGQTTFVNPRIESILTTLVIQTHLSGDQSMQSKEMKHLQRL